MSPTESPTLVLLTIQSSAGAVSFILPDEITDGYTNTFEVTADQHRTHPGLHMWTKGEVDELTLDIELAVGVSLNLNTPDDLVRMVETLYTMALPPQTGGKKPYVEAVTVSISGGGSLWFRRKYFIKSVKPTWKTPVDVATGKPLVARVAMVLVPTYTIQFSFKAADAKALPKRPYSFSKG